MNCIILTGSERAYAAGADIKTLASLGPVGVLKMDMYGLWQKIKSIRKPVIAAVSGFALGGGLELAMACHFRVASDNAKMGLPEVSLGLIPGYGGTQRLPQLIGRGRAIEMIMTAGMIPADEAFRAGLVNHVVPQNELLDFCKGIAQRINKK